MPDAASFAQLPDDVTLDRQEVSTVLFALDLLDGSNLEGHERNEVRKAIRVLTAKLWPELGDLLGDEGEG